MTEALKGLRVLEIGHVVAGPFCSTLLGDFGAEVIKIETPGVGDSLRNMGAMKNETSLWFAVEGRNKKCVTLDLKSKKGKELFKKLVNISDVVVENFRPGTLEKLGLGWDVLQEINKRLILVRISGYGQDGPYTQKPGFDRIANAVGGLTYLTGYPDSPPLRPALAIADYMTGMFAALGVMFALYHRDIQGQNTGQIVDIGLYESVFRVMEDTVTNYSLNGIVRERMGNTHPGSVPGSNYLTSDGKWLVLSIAGDRVFKKFSECLGMPELAEDLRFKTQPDRLSNRDQIEEITSKWVADHTLQECLDVFSDHIPASPVYSIQDIMQDPHYRARQNIVEVQDQVLGTFEMQNVVPKLSETPGKVRHSGPALGAYNDYIFRELLGLSQAEMEAMRNEGVM